MKSKVFKAVVMIAFAFITGLNFYKAKTEVKLSDAQLKNVEALATSEDVDLEAFCDKKDNELCYDFVFTPSPDGGYFKGYLNWENKNEFLP